MYMRVWRWDRAHTHTHMHTHTHTNMHSCTYTLMHTHPPTHTHTPTCIHTLMHTQAHTLTYTHTNTHTRTHIHTYIHTYTHRNVSVHSQTQHELQGFMHCNLFQQLLLSCPHCWSPHRTHTHIHTSDVPLRCTLRCTVIRYGTEIRRTTVSIRCWTIYTVKYGTAYGAV